ncbi:MAG: DUF928 domain-containing protein [Geminicoccales bacterium]
MTRQGFWIVALLAGIGHALLSASSMADEKPNDEPEKKTIEETLETIVFIPHDVGAPGVTDAGGVRSITALPNLEPLAPSRLSRSLSPAPMLYWYLSKGTEMPVRFTLLAEDPAITDPILDVELGIYPNAGIYAVPLEGYGIMLEDDQRYSWSVALLSADGDISSTMAQTWFEHNASADTTQFISTLAPVDQIAYLARNGYWYDAIDTLSQRLKTDDRSAPWREIRAHLLDQVGLKKPANFDRQQGAR